MKKLTAIVFSLLCFTIHLISCTKEIELDVDAHEQKIVIEAHVGTEIGDNSVLISKSKSLNSKDPIVPISGATVTVKDLLTGQVFAMPESAGVYSNDQLAALGEHTYELSVTVEGKTYTSKSTVPKNVQLTEFTQKDSLDNNSFGFDNLAALIPKYNDPADRENFYQFVIYRNDSLQQDILIRDDIVYNGLEVSQEIYVEARKNDTVTVDFQGIDKPVYRYLFGFAKNVYQSSGTPANPVSNISNGALGYFKAHTSNFYEVVVK